MSPSAPPTLPLPMQLMQLITGHWVAASLFVAAKLGLADQLLTGPRSADELALATGAHGPSVYRLMRALAGLGVFEELPEKRFGLNLLGELMTTDHPASMRSMALFQGSQPHWKAWGNFLHSVKTGESAFAQVHGRQFFDYTQTDPEFSEAFNGAMTGITASAIEAVLEAYDFSGIKKLADVGGGHGYLLSRILTHYPQMHGIVADLPHVVAGAVEPLAAAGLADRCETKGVNFFETVPLADAYISKHIIHDWDDEHCLKILSNMRGAVQEGGRVLLVEAVIDPHQKGSPAVMIDLEMLNSTHGGRERTRQEFAELFAKSGWRLERVIETRSIFCVIEARPA